MYIISNEQYAQAVSVQNKQEAEEMMKHLQAQIKKNGVADEDALYLAKKGLKRYIEINNSKDYRRLAVLYGLGCKNEPSQERKKALLEQVDNGNYSDEILAIEVSEITRWRKEIEGEDPKPTFIPEGVH